MKLELDISGGEITASRVGGDAVIIAEGMLTV
jgi:hypothetical protein